MINRPVKSAIDILNKNWAALSGLSIIYVFFTSITSTYLYYRDFGISPFIYFDLMDYPRILIKDNKVPYVPFLALILPFLAITAKPNETIEFLEAKRFTIIAWHKAALRTIPILLWTTFAYTLIFLPGLQAMDLSKATKSDPKCRVTVKMNDGILEDVIQVGGTSKYLFFYNPTESTSIAVNAGEIKLIKTLKTP